MFENKRDYFQLVEFKDFHLKAIYTTKSYGDVMKMEKEKFIKDFSFNEKFIVAGHQTHSDNVAIIEKESEKLYFEDTDGFITNREDIVIYTKYADCLPIFLFDKEKKVFGVVHSGWQGSYKEIGKKAIKLMKERYSSKLEDIVVAFGIGISKKRYEVQEDFMKKFKEKFPQKLIEESFEKIGDKIYFDNQYFNYLNLIDYGILKENLICNNLCTYNGDFHSYRRDRELSGRNGAFISFE